MSLLQTVVDGMDSSWPDDTTLYFQDEVAEISLPDFARSLSIRTFLQMCKLKFKTERRSNAEYLSTTGKVPVFRQKNLILTSFDDIVSHVNVKQKGLDGELNEKTTAEMNAHLAMVQSVLGNAEVYIAWTDPVVANEVTKPRAGSVYSWPLNVIVPFLKQREMKKIIRAKKWQHLSENEVCEKVRQVCQALTVRLGQKKFFFGDRVTALDALVFGHLFAIVTTTLPNNCLSAVIKDFDNLQEFLRRVNDIYFSEEKVASPQIHAR
ncbi:metaxin-2-like [Watersipora subatra]|uniref:metaxin-2-like n=1 Tax=Watersipora subatra TaxID=2589382 RepID=UPI00355BCACC